MGMFDWYEPDPPPICPLCGDTPNEWQGTDGPNALLVWSQGRPSPTEHRVDPELPNLDALLDARLPEAFWFAGWDVNGHTLDVAGSSLAGVWNESTLLRVTEIHQGRHGRSFVRVLWGTRDPLTPKGTSDR